MKKYLISLEKDQLRRDHFFAQENTLDFEIFTAINTMDSQQDLHTLFNQDKFQQQYGRAVTKGEIGCTLSHLAVYQKIVSDKNIANDEYILICEDDVLFTDNFQYHLAHLLNEEKRADILLVGQSKIKEFNDIELEINYPTTFSFLTKKNASQQFISSYPYRPYFAGTVAYLIKKSATNIILDNMEKHQLPYWLADDFILFEQFGLDIKVVRPLMAIENQNLQSNLANSRGEIAHHRVKKWLKYPLKKLLALKRNLGKV